ncbi:MAG: glycoside hydrolase family 32 protein [Planctomycetota bacterium]
MYKLVLVSLSLLLAPAAAFGAEADVIVADFEGDSYGEWVATGEAFGPGPAKGTLSGQMHVEGYEGQRLVNSFFKGDATTGTLTSPEFTLQRKFVCFLIGGGQHEGKTCINLLVAGKVARTATGTNDKPGGSERLDWHSWDVSDLAGKKVRLQIVDAATGGWGHVNVDHILQSDTRRGSQLARRELVVATNYLQLPVKTGAAKRRVKFLIDGRTVREFEIELAEKDADFQALADVRPFKGKALTIEALLPSDSNALNAVTPSDEQPLSSDADQNRPGLHFTSRRGWLNDPNGLVQHAGEWHLFYQHNPYGWSWGNMHWGHAVSKDLLHWTELPTALYPQQWGDWAFSGSAVVDARNTSGFKTGSDDVLVAAYTSTGRGECIVFSNDRGRTWTEFDKNPVVKHNGRDPKLVWHAASSRWVMAVYDEQPDAPTAEAKQGISFFTSPDLKEWTFASRIDGFYECPDLFPLAIDGDKANQKWVLYAADGKYVLGDFDGKTFTKESGKHQVWFGNFYAAQTFDNAPNGRRVQIGWGQGIEFKNRPFNQQMTIPVELTLRPTSRGVRLFAWPVKEVEAASQGRAHATILSIDRLKLVPGREVTVTVGGTLDQFDLTLELEVGTAEKITLTVCGTPIVYDAKQKKLACRHVTAPVSTCQGRVSLRVIGDRGSLEIFVNKGEAALSIGHTPSDTDRTWKALATGGEATLHRPSIANLNATE